MRPDTITQTLLDIWGRHCEEGDYVFVSRKDPVSGGWKDQPIKYDQNTKEVVSRWIKKNPADKYNLYFCPLPFTKPGRKEQNLRGSQYLWSDLDEVNVDDLPFKPSIYWESSPGRFQGLWVLDRFMEPEEVKSLNRKLTYASGADKGGWDLTQVLRIPGTRNHKYEGSPRVGQIQKPDIKNSYQVAKLQEHLETGAEDIGIEHEVNMPILNPLALLAKYRKKLSRKVIGLLTTSRPTEGKRSQVIWYLENKLLEAGLTPPEIFTLVKNSPWNKYRGRADEDHRLKTELEKIIEGKSIDMDDPEPPTQREFEEQMGLRLESYAEVMGNLKTYPGWLVEGFWMRRSYGIVAGEPKSFKSILTTDLAVSVASGEPFLGQFPVTEQGPVLIVQNENAKWIVTDRIQKMITQKGLTGKVERKSDRHLTVTFPPVLPIHFMNQQGFMLTDPIHQAIVEKVIQEYKPILVIFDPLYLMFDGDLNSAKDLSPVLSWLLKLSTEYNTGVQLIHHLNKAGTSARGGQRILGSTTLHGWYESAWIIKVKGETPQVEDDEDEYEGIVKTSGEPVPLVLEREFRGGGVRRKVEMILELGEFGDPKYKVNVQQHVGRGRPAATGTSKQQLLHALSLKAGAMSQRRLSEETGVGRRALKKMLDDLAEEGLVNITAEGIILL